MKNYQSITIVNEGEEAEKYHLNSNVLYTDANNINGTSNYIPIILNDHPQDHLAPPYASPERLSNLFVASFNLIATIVGGAVLSLPIAFAKCGIFFTTLSMILSAYMTYISLVMLCYSSRRSGGSSYGEVVRSAFGEKAEEAVSWILFIFLMFVITAYMVLIRDIWTPLVNIVVVDEDLNGDYVLLGIVGLLLPFLVQRSLHALRFNCYIGSASIFILCIALCRGGWQRFNNEDDDTDTDYEEDDVVWFKIPSIKDVLFSFPITMLAFLCHFNIISIQNALCQPTRKRTDHMIQYSIGVSFLLMYLFGLGGYLYAGSSTQGNILRNVPVGKRDGEDNGEYYLFLLGRVGIGTTIMLAMPLMALPCREALLEVVDVWFHQSHHITTANVEAPRSPTTEESSCWKVLHQFNRAETDHDAVITTEDEVVTEEISMPPPPTSPVLRRVSSGAILIRHDPIQSDYIFRNTLTHYGSTLLITATCYFGAVAVSGVATVWSFIGSSMAFFIAFILPCGCFIVIESMIPTIADGGDRKEKWIQIAWIILIFAIVGAVVCTTNSIIGGTSQ